MEITPTRRNPDALFLREGWATATADGASIEFSRTAGGGALLLTVTKEDGEKIVESIDIEVLIETWAESILNPTPENDDDTPEDGYALHIGVHAEYVEQVVAALNAHPDITRAVADGDGWEEWGEAPDDADTENRLNPEARHVVVFADRYEHAITAVETTCNHLLVPMQLERQRGVVLVVTDPHDWSVQIDDPYTSITLATA